MLCGQVADNKETVMITRFLEPKVDAAYPLLRIVAGLMFAFHGVQKLFGVLSSFQPAVGTQAWFGGIIELVTGLAIAVGLLTSWAAFLASGTMAVAYVQFHWKLALDAQFFPTLNKGELALLYAVVFLYIACRGGGAWSVDRRRARSGRAVAA
jgi:putative oxidoreductase